MTSSAPQNASARTRATSNASSGKPLHLEMPEPRFLSIVPSDRDGSSPDEQQDGTPMLEEDAHSVVGVSINRAQTRLLSPQTPAAEKAAAMGGLDKLGMFDGAADDNGHSQEDAGVNEEPTTPRHSSEEPFTSTNRQHSVTLPSPWRAEPQPFEKLKTHGQDHQAIGPTSMLADLNARRYLSSFNLPSLPKTPNFRDISIPSLSSILSNTRSRSPIQRAATRQKRASTFADMKSGFGFWNQPERRPSGDLAKGQDDTAPSLASDGNTSLKPQSNARRSPTPSTRGRRASSDKIALSPQESRLHRSTSDQSLMLRRATSIGSSLGDDSRWENVQDQVNSRMKAIKDSFQDSSIRLPRMPNVSTLNLDSFRPDFTRPRAQSEAKRPMRMTNGEATADARAHVMHDTAPQGLQLLGNGTLMDKKPKSTHPYLEQALEHLTGDLVVMGGYRGSVLRSAKPPNRQLWVPIKVGLNIRKVDLEVGLQPEDEENMKDYIYASGMLSHIGPVDMGRRLLKRLRACKHAQDGTLRVHDYGYDWRLSPHLLSRRLIEFLERLPSNADAVPDHKRGANILAHSMGGLITRHSVNQRPELFRGVIFAGVPQHCVNILGPLRNGDEVLLSSNVLTAQVNFTLRSSFLLLPEDGKCFINKATKEEYPVNFFDVEHWKQYAWSPCIAPALPAAHPPENKGLLGSMADMLNSFPSLALPGRKLSVSRSRDDKSPLADAANTASTKVNDIANASSARSLDPQMGPSSSLPNNGNAPQSTIPLPDALAYLQRTLDQTVAFKSEMAHNPDHTSKNRYPPFAILYANNTPTVVAARVASRDGIRRADAYDDLQFASGDGVCLARAAMLPPGHSERPLLPDLPACSTTLYPVEITFVFSALFRSLVVRSFAIPSLHKYLAWFAYQKLAAYAFDILAFRTSAGAASLPAHFPKFSRVAVGLPVLSLLHSPSDRYLEWRRELEVRLRAAPPKKLAVDNRAQDMWVGDDVQGGSMISSVSGPSRSEFENFTAENVGGTKITLSAASSLSNGKGPIRTPGVMRTGDLLMRNGHSILPHAKAFSIQIGWRLFRLSGASINSDAPSYFSNYFEEQLRLDESGNGPTKTLFIDRDPDTFADICRHLQGYYVLPRDNAHYVRLYADAQFYSLQRLISQLFDAEIFVSIGGQQFQIPRDTFSGAGNSSNFFSLGFAGFLGSRDDAFPGLESRGLMRPPAVQPQTVPNRSPKAFEDLIHLSRGYPLTIRDKEHRAQLLSDCKYYGFKGLMHKLFVHSISYNAERGKSEIIMQLEDLHKSGVSFVNDASPSDQSPLGGWVNYMRPFVDETSYEAIVEIGSQETKIDFRSMRADFYGDTKARISSLFQTVADKMNLPHNLPLGLMMSSGGASAAPASPANTPLSEDRVKIRIGQDAHIILDGQEHTMDESALDHQQELEYNPEIPTPSSASLAPGQSWPNPTMRPSSTRPPPMKKRKRRGSLDDFGEWIVRKGQWRMRVQPRVEYSSRGSRGEEDGGMEIVLCAVKLDAVSGQRGRNMGRGFVS